MRIHKILGFLERLVLSGIMSVIVFVADWQLRKMQARTMEETNAPNPMRSARMSRVQDGEQPEAATK